MNITKISPGSNNQNTNYALKPKSLEDDESDLQRKLSLVN